jgi:hypothetical protein
VTLEQLLKPRVALPLLAVALIVTILLLPAPEALTPVDHSGPLTTKSTKPAGASGLYEIAQRLGWPVERRQLPFAAPLDSASVYLVLDPPEALLGSEAHALLDAVRRGAGLVYVTGSGFGLGGAGSEMDDSLHVLAGGGSTMLPSRQLVWAPPCPKEKTSVPEIMWGDDSVRLYSLRRTRAWPDDTTMFVAVRATTRSSSGVEPAALGYPLGAGRVVVVSDPDLLRNDAIRVCQWELGPIAVRMLDYASAGKRPTLVFDEYHFGSNSIVAAWTPIGDFLADTSAGHAVAQIAVAGLVLLAAAAWRPVAPVARERIERRSALEHVEALARAYARVGATRTAVRRLVRGLRRRHARRAAATADDRFLAGLAAQTPSLNADVQRILQGLDHTITPAELIAVGHAVDHIDRVLRT